MTEFLSHAKSFFTEGFSGPALLSMLAVWILGKLSGSKPYIAVRAAWGKFCRGLGVQIDNIAGSKIGRPLWNPIEKVLVDFLGFGSEQLVAGLQENDLQAMAEQHERLESVGSVARVAVIKQKMEMAIAQGADIPEGSEAVAKVLAESQAWALRQKLES